MSQFNVGDMVIYANQADGEEIVEIDKDGNIRGRYISNGIESITFCNPANYKLIAKKGTIKMAEARISNEELMGIKQKLEIEFGGKVRAVQIKKALTELNPPVFLDESTIRGKFLEMGAPLGGGIGEPKLKEAAPISQKPMSKALEIVKKVYAIPDALKVFIPQASEFAGYIERAIDARLAMHYNCSRPGNWKYPITQGPQGTGKTYGHMYYAFKEQLPFFLFCCYEEFKLFKLFGDKTIQGGSVVFKEGLFVTAIQNPGVILFDEFNYVSNENSVDFHALLQNRELFVKDADNGNGKVYKLHEDCRIGFAQNPKSAKYIGGNIKPSSFLGRCTYLTYPQFTKADIKKSLVVKFPNLITDDVNKFTEFYFGCLEIIEKAQIPIDISIRQLNNVVDLFNHGMTIGEAIEDGLSAITDAASTPKNKEAFARVAQLIWKDLLETTINDKVGKMK